VPSKSNLSLVPWPNPTRKAHQITKKERSKHDQHESSTELTTGSGHYEKSKFCTFCSYFLIFFLILYHLNRKHTNSQQNWTVGVSYRNFTIFSSKFKAPSRLSVRCLRSRIWASSHGQTRLGKHSRSQRKKHHNMISMKAQRSSRQGQTTSRNPNFALFSLIF
jgi:hypothetical protein